MSARVVDLLHKAESTEQTKKVWALPEKESEPVDMAWEYRITGVGAIVLREPEDNETEDDLATRSAKDVANLIKNSQAFAYLKKEDEHHELEQKIADFECCTDLEEFNGNLEELYDIGDFYRVFIH